MKSKLLAVLIYIFVIITFWSMVFKNNIINLILLVYSGFIGSSIKSYAQESIIINDTEKKNIISAPVTLELDTLFVIQDFTSNYPVSLRAKDISKRIERLLDEYNPISDSIYLNKRESYIELKHKDDIIFIISQVEAEKSNLSLPQLANIRLSILQKRLDSKKPLTPKQQLKNIGFFALSFLVLIGFLKLVNWLFKRLNVRLSKIEKNFLKKNSNIIKYFIPRNTANIFVFISNVVRIALIIIVLFVYAPFMFSFFPWAEHLVKLFYSYISTPIKYVVVGFINFIPSLFFIIIIALVARYIVRVINEIASDVEIGRFHISNFHQDWAKPTSKILSLFIYAMALVLIFPYLPGSGSSAFQGVSIFIGAIISFGSTSAISNIIAGIVITYMRPFQIGDRIKIDNITGDVLEKTTLVTRIRTLKNEDVTIPNAKILTGTIVNYSNNDNKTIILHTTITLGYDLPWQTAQELLLSAADKTELVEKEPKPFVLQTSLDDYYVSYQLNAHTKEAKKMPAIYSELHKNILEVFNEAGVEILSPSYMAARDGSLSTVPSQLKPEDKSPLDKIVEHLTGRNQKTTISKPNSESHN